MPSVAIVGGGITGLIAAYRLRGRADVVVLEGSDRWGGKIRTRTVDGMTLEEGPDSFLPRDEVPLQLCRELGLESELVEPADFGAWLLRGGRLVELPPGFTFGLPSSPAAIVRSRILSPVGALRAAGDLVLPGPLVGPDVSIGEFVARRFGREVLERLVDPLLAGTRAGDVMDISLAAAAPQIDAIARSHRSVTLGLRKATEPGARPRFFSLRRGMGALIEALLHALGDTDLRTGARVQRIGGDVDGYIVETDTETLQVDGVIAALPPHQASTVLAGVSPEAGDALGRITFASVATATFTYPAGSVAIPARGSGVLVPRSEGRTIAACTWYSAKWPHLVPRDRVVIRAFAGRNSTDPVLADDDNRLLGRMAHDVADLMTIDGDPTHRHLTRWDQGIPQLRVGHLDLVARIEQALGAHPRLALAGAGYRGTGIPDCIAQAGIAAERVLASS